MNPAYLDPKEWDGRNWTGKPSAHCGKKCDHDSPCVLRVDHEPRDRHETDHGCVFFDPRGQK
jgi:hypothetical protein